MRFRTVTLLSLCVIFAAATPALGAIDVNITGVLPLDAVIGTGETAMVYWTISVGTESGSYEVVVGGDGTPGTGDPVVASNGSGTFSGTKTGSTTISADNDLEDDGDYTIYVIAEDDEDGENYGSAGTTITLDTPPGMVNGVRAGTGDGRIFLEWDSHEDTDINRFLVYYGTSSGQDTANYSGTDSDLGTSPVDAGLTTEVILSGLENGLKYFVRLTAVDDSGTESPLSAEVSATPTETQGLADLKNDTEGCFIATAAFGSQDHARVRVLRRFRDRVLLKTDGGTAFIRAYYRHAPRLASFIGKHPVMKGAVRATLIPVAILAEAFLDGRALVSFLFAGGLASLLLIRRKRAVEARGGSGAAGGLLIAACALAFSFSDPNLASAQESPQSDLHWNESPRSFSAGFNVGMIFSQDEDYQDVYGTKGVAIYTLQMGWRVFHELELHGEMSYAWAEGRGVSPSGRKTQEKFKIHMAPAELGLLYRLAFVPDQVVVPYLGAGFLYGYWFEERLDSSYKNRGLLSGAVGQAGLALLLDNIEKRAAGHLESQWGINNTYLFYQYKYHYLNDFGKEENTMDLSSQIHTAGILFQF